MIELHVCVITGFEQVASEEIKQTLKVKKINVIRGGCRFEVEMERIPEILKLRSIDNVHCVVLKKEIAGLMNMSKEDSLEEVRGLLRDISWKTLIDSWEIAHKKEVQGKERITEELDRFLGTRQPNEIQGDVPTFRVTAKRAGEAKIHSFTSMEAARELGATINNCFGWKPDMKGFDLEIILDVRWNQVTVMVSLNRESLFKRNMVAYGPTTMRSTMCYCMLALAKPQPGSLIVDTMCGGGSIPLEGALSFKGCSFIGGDMHPLALERCRENMMANSEVLRHCGSYTDFSTWDATRMPFKTNSVDAVVTDLPFGKKIGSTTDNRILYPQLLKEWADIVKPGGTLVVMTHDKRSLENSLKRDQTIPWQTMSTHMVNQGGLTTLCARLTNCKPEARK